MAIRIDSQKGKICVPEEWEKCHGEKINYHGTNLNYHGENSNDYGEGFL